ncbi:DEAD/DEAH box helicase [Actinacidiphila glaucinigra]|uniref:DEAD/DEAH box helicase n=1 Tax=Actinacidiphila glaucinigra TaxID=235986 RepID=UPI000B7778A2|nr:DEAD/DEAH box helicase [Actinacidiphila glaucinigra]
MSTAIPAAGPTGATALRPDQQAGLDRAVRHLHRPGTRGLYVSACGTGKTLVGIRLAGTLGSRLTLVVVPTLDLIAQTALAWRRDGRAEAMVAVCSMDTRAHPGLAEANVGSTGDATGLAAVLSAVGTGVLDAVTVLCTYDSLDKIEAAQRTGRSVPSFDLAIMDEAHRIAGRADKRWAAVNDNARIKADRRLYMTATPRIFGGPDLAESADVRRPRRRRLAEPDVDASANSMDSEPVYGKKIFEYPLAQAVADGVLADYQVIVPTISDDQLRTRLNLPTTPTATGLTPGAGDALRTTALHLAVLKTMAEHQLKRVLVYFQLVADAKRFTRELGHTLRLLRTTAPELCPDLDPLTLYVDGDHTPSERAEVFARFAQAPCAIMANAKVVAEGVDIPSVDAVVFADVSRSVIRVVQALGRALRQPADAGKVASLVIPAYIPPAANPLDILGTPYEPVWAIATALASHDHRIAERLPNKTNRLPQETRELIAHRWHFDFTVQPERIARAMDLVSFDPRAAESRPRREGLASAQAFHDDHGHLDVPTDYTDPTGYNLGAFITGMRDARRTNRLNPHDPADAAWIAELDALDMIWDKHDAAWRAQLTTAADYHAAHGHLAIPVTAPGGAFLAEQRSLAANGRLDPARAADLATIDPHWRLPHGPDWHRKYHLLRAHLAAGHNPGDLHLDIVIGTVKIGRWLHRQLTTFTTLDPGQQQLLTDLGLTPATSSLKTPSRARRTFAQTVQLLELFIAREGRPPTAREEILVDGDTVKIGPWLAKARTKHRTGQLPVDHATLIASLFEGDWTDDTTPVIQLA